MGLSGSAFRVLGGRDPQVSTEPTFVTFRLDPQTFDFSEVGGHPQHLLGFPPRDWFGARFWSGRLHPGDREAAGAFFHDLASRWRDEQLQYRVIDAAGNTVWVHQVICVERDGRGGSDGREAVAIRGVLIDITERMAHEANVERALFLKGEVFRIIVEELAPPVRAISVYGDMLGRHLAAQGDDVGSDYVVNLRDGLQRVDMALGHLLRIAQSGAADGEVGAGSATLHSGDPLR